MYVGDVEKFQALTNHIFFNSNKIINFCLNIPIQIRGNLNLKCL